MNTRAGREQEHDDLTQRCLEAEQLLAAAGPERAEAALLDLTKKFPKHAAPRKSLARLYRRLARRDLPRALNRGRLRQALSEARLAVECEDPPRFETLRLLHVIMHDLAMHAENASYFREIGRRHPEARTRFHALCWAAIALQCQGMALAAEGKELKARQADSQAVECHREALAAWPNAPVDEVLSSYFGESHIIRAYSLSGAAREWVREVEGLLGGDRGLELPVDDRAQLLWTGSDMASDAGMKDEAVRLAKTACEELRRVGFAGRHRLQWIHALGALLRATHASGDSEAIGAVADQIEERMKQWERASQHEDARLSKEYGPAGGYNSAARNFIRIRDWERAIRMARRATELWDCGPNYVFLAVALWAGRKDREETLRALRNAARDALLSGVGQCRNLRQDFMSNEVFADVRDDPEFLEAIEVKGVIEKASGAHESNPTL